MNVGKCIAVYRRHCEVPTVALLYIVSKLDGLDPTLPYCHAKECILPNHFRNENVFLWNFFVILLQWSENVFFFLRSKVVFQTRTVYNVYSYIFSNCTTPNNVKFQWIDVKTYFTCITSKNIERGGHLFVFCNSEEAFICNYQSLMF